MAALPPSLGVRGKPPAKVRWARAAATCRSPSVGKSAVERDRGAIAATSRLVGESGETFVQRRGGHQECVMTAELFAGFASSCNSVTDAPLDV